MAFTEKELEGKSLSEIASLLMGCERKIKELADSIRIGEAKPADMMALNSDLALLKKMRDKKTEVQSRTIKRGQQPKTNTPLKSYDDYLKSKK